MTSRALRTLPETAADEQDQAGDATEDEDDGQRTLGREGERDRALHCPSASYPSWAQPSTVQGLTQATDPRLPTGMKFSRTMSSPSDPARVASSSARSVDFTG